MEKTITDKVLYFDLSNGASGDMIIGALLDSFSDKDDVLNKVNKELSKLNKDISIVAKKTVSGVISGMDIKIVVGKGDHVVDAEKVIDSKEHKHHHHHRGFAEIVKIIEDSSLEDEIKIKSINIFRRLGEAEAKIHGKTIDDIHFHEIGALDTIGDVVSSVILIRMLEVTKIVSSPANLGTGTVECAHGILNLPAPASLEILKSVNAKCYIKETGKEIFTPTAAAILAEFTGRFDHMPELELATVGYGIGKNKPLNNQSILRAICGNTSKATEDNSEVRYDKKSFTIEVNIDDMNPEHYEYLSELLFEKGAQDVCVIPIMMKKNRPGSKISVICKKEDLQKLINIIFKHSTTTGVRFYEVMRQTLKETFVDVMIKGERIQVKHSYSGDVLMNIAPEYEDCKKTAKKLKMPLKEVYNIAIQESKAYV